jgi:hypothetical protein
MRTSSALLTSPPMTIALTAAAIAVILSSANLATIANAQQQQLTSQPGEIGNATTAATTAATRTFQGTNDSFRVQVPVGWIIHDMNNTGSTLLEETRQGYGILAQLCPEEQQGAALSTNASGGSTNSSSSSITSNSCQGAQVEVIHIVRYPDLDTRLPADTNVTTNNNMTNDNILSYHLQKLQEVGYRDIQIVNSSDMIVNLTIAQTNQTVATVPAKVIEMTYTTAIAPNGIRSGYLISTATNATSPNLGTTKGYTIFYEGSPVSAAEITIGFGSLSPLPPPVGQVFNSFELIAAPEVAQAIAQEAQAAETTEGGDDDGDDGEGEDGDDGEGEDGDDGEGEDGDDGEGEDGDDGEGEDGDDGGDDDGDDGGEEGGAGMAERLIEETREIVERIIEETR